MEQNEKKQGVSSLNSVVKIVWMVAVVVVLVVVGRIACSDGTQQEKLDALIGGIE